MAATLYLTPTTHTAMDHALAQIRAAQASVALAPAYLLLPDVTAIQHLYRHLGNSVGIHLFEFYRLGERVLRQAGEPARPVTPPAIRRLLRHLLTQMHERGELTSLDPVWDKPGLVQVLLEWVREMKSQGIRPEALQAHLTNEHEVQLALLYGRYQRFLQQRGYVDADGLLWLAVEALEAKRQLLQQASPFLVLGFDQFTPIQLQFLHQLAARLPALSIYLLWDEARSPESLALTRLRHTREALEHTLNPTVQLLTEVGAGEPVLAHLRRSLFEAVPPLPATGSERALQAVEAPSREGEVRWALRAIKQRLLEGQKPEQVALLAPQPESYRSIVLAVADEYGVPVTSEQGLFSNPAVATLVSLLRLAPDFPRRETLDALRSPYLQQPWLTPEQIAWLDRLTRERPMVAGREQWRQALYPLGDGTEGSEDEPWGSRPLAAMLSAETLATIERGLMAFFDHLTPPRGEYRDLTLWLQEAILGLLPEDAADGEAIPSLHLRACCENGDYAERDLRALAVVLQAMRVLIEAAEFVPPREEERLVWGSYRAELLGLLATLTYRPAALAGAVRFGALEAGRAVEVEELFILGLSEGEFPRAPQPDLFYSREERAAHPLPLRQVDPAEEASLWWQVVSNSRRHLTLLRPRLDENGAPWLPSPYWEATLSLIDGMEARVQIPPLAPVPRPEEAASRAELLLALMSTSARAIPAVLRPSWQAARRAHHLMLQRQSGEPPGVYEGVLSAPDLLEELAQKYGPTYGWSPSHLNRYGSCPYGFFARVILRLEAWPEPEEGLDARQWGSLLHALLEELHTCLSSEGLTLTAANREAVLARLDECCERLFRSAPRRYGFRASPLWEYEKEELRRLLRAVVAWECEAGSGGERFLPFQQEVRFGLESSLLPRLLMEDESGIPFLLQGVIDRIDRDAEGYVRIVDYKSGSQSYSENDIRRGLAFQSALYALAAEQLIPDISGVLESYYLHLPTRERSGRLSFATQVYDHDAVQAAVTQAAHFVAQVRAGRFPSAPGKPGQSHACGSACEFAGLCRVTRRSIAKAKQQESQSHDGE